MNNLKESDIRIDMIRTTFDNIHPLEVRDDLWEEIIDQTAIFVSNYNKTVSYIENKQEGTFFDFLPSDRFNDLNIIIKEEYISKVLPKIEIALQLEDNDDNYLSVVSIIYHLMSSAKDTSDVITAVSSLCKRYLLNFITTFMTNGYWEASFVILEEVVKSDNIKAQEQVLGELCVYGLYGNIGLLLSVLKSKKEDNEFVTEKTLRTIVRENYINTFNVLLEYNQIMRTSLLNYSIYYSNIHMAKLIYNKGVPVNNNQIESIHSCGHTAFRYLSTITSAFLSLDMNSVNIALEMGCAYSDFSFFGFINFNYRLMREHNQQMYYNFLRPFFDNIVVRGELVKAITEDVNYYYRRKKDFVKHIAIRYPHALNSSVPLVMLLKEFKAGDELLYKIGRRMQLAAIDTTDIELWNGVFNVYGYPTFGLVDIKELIRMPVFYYLRDNDPNFTNVDPRQLFSSFPSLVDAYPTAKTMFENKQPPMELRDKYRQYLNDTFNFSRERDIYDSYNHMGYIGFEFEDMLSFYHHLGLSSSK